MGQPSLSLAAKLQRRTLRGGLPADLLGDGLGGDLGDRLFALVAEAVAGDVEAEAALRASAVRFRDRVLAAEAHMRSEGVGWREAWRA
jgi:XTP/dITP diphosphohydrolase